MSTKILTVYCVLLLAYNGTCYEVIPASILKGIKDGEPSYAVTLHVGTPLKEIVLEISFSYNTIILFKDVSSTSQSYTFQDQTESDIFYIADMQYRIPFIQDQYKSRFFEFRPNCTTCDGIIGLGEGSFFWRIYPDASFSQASITLGGINQIMARSSDCVGTPMTCERYSFDSLCTTVGVVNGKNYTIKFSLDSQFTYLPFELYDPFVMGNNVYESSTENWSPLYIDIPKGYHSEIDSHALLHMKSQHLDVKECEEDKRITLDPADMIGKSENGMKVLLVRSNQEQEDNEITIGISILSQFMIYRHTGSNTMVIQSHLTRRNISPINLVIFSVLLWLLVRWKMTDMSISMSPRRTNIKSKKISDTVKISSIPFSIGELNRHKTTNRESIVNLVYEFLSVPLVITVMFLPITVQILEDFPGLYTIVIISFFVSLSTEMICLIIFIRRNERDEDSESISNLLVHATITRNIAYESNLILGLWLCLLERRLEGIATLLTVVINVYGLYNMTFYIGALVIFYIYDTPSFRESNVIIWIYTTFIFPLIYASFIYITFVYFIYPLFLRTSTVYRALIIPSIVFGYLVIVILAIYVLALYIENSKSVPMFKRTTKNKLEQRSVSKSESPEKKLVSRRATYFDND
jgi:hypothetical protein